MKKLTAFQWIIIGEIIFFLSLNLFMPHHANRYIVFHVYFAAFFVTMHIDKRLK